MKKIYLITLLCLLFSKGFSQFTNNYSQRIEYYSPFFTAGTSGAFNSGNYQLGMYSNGGTTKQIFGRRTLKTDGVNAGALRSLKVGDEFRISVSANTVVGTMGFALLASPTSSRSNWGDRLNNAAISFNLDNYGFWYARCYDGTTVNNLATAGSQNVGGSTSYKNFTFTCLLTAPNRMNATITDGTTTSVFYDLFLNTASPITEYSIYLSDDWNGLGHRDVYWNTSSSSNSDYIKNTKNISIGASNGTFNVDEVLSNGLDSNSTTAISVNSFNKKGNGTIGLTAQNTYTGLTTVEGGTLQLNRTGGNTIPNTNNVSVSAGAILKISSNQTLNDLTLNGTGALQIDNGATLIIKGTLSAGSTSNFNLNSSGNLVIDSGATLNINGSYSDTSGRIILNNNANLLQNAATTNNANTGSIVVKRNSANIQLYDYTLWSSPVAGQKLKAFSPDTLDARFYSYNSDTNQYNVVSNPTNTDFVSGTGYLIRAPNNWTAGATAAPYIGTFTGTPNNGTITISPLTSAKFYAVGNPYPSTISAAAFYTENASAGTLYFWRRTNGNISTTAYATLNRAGATGTSFGLTPSTDIAIGQGFIVSPGTSTLRFTNAMRTSINSATFLRANEERSRFWLNLTSLGGSFCQTLLAYMPNATSGIDNGIDGRYFNDAPVALTSLIGSEEYTIQGRALPFSISDSVPLGFKTNEAENYTIAIDHLDGLFGNGQAIYLKDNLLNTVTNLGAGSYSFASAAGTFNSRFEIVYQNMLGVNNPEFTSNNVVVFNDNGDININSGSTVMEQVRVYDLQGRLLVEKKQINASETKITTMVTNQVLLLEITAASGIKVTKKIIQ
ncbi:MAG: T9SS sorting signal type C domain-containing protein [Flavobacterium sp.]|nr:T9SS sorting signal type C domain-containing protein [Flavobacterium sp.]